MTYLVQLLLPTHHNDGTVVSAAEFAAVRLELTDRFGGVTAYTRTPATGLWKNPEDDVEHDQVIMVEVVVEVFDRDWWAEYRARLEHRFGQDELHVRALPMEQI